MDRWDKLARLSSPGIEVDRASAEFTNGGKTYPAGSYRIELAQPAKRMIRTFLDADVPMNEEFLKEQQRLREKRLPDEITTSRRGRSRCSSTWRW
jgi:hypothetical protein